MNEIKKTTLHPDNQPNTDLYPKTSADQVEGLSDIIGTLNVKIDTKLTKPTNPSAESAVIMLADGTVGTKLLSEIVGGGGKLYKHEIFIMFEEFIGGGSITIYSTSLTKITGLPRYNYYKMVLTGPTVSGVVRADAYGSTSYVDFYGAVSSSGGEAVAYYAKHFTITDFSDTVTEL